MLDYAQLSALAAVVRTGSFEQAAQQLNVTPSAVSQRVKLLEERIGAVLVVRGQPCLATEAGERLCQHVEQVALLESSLRQGLPGLRPESRPVTLRIAVNADSLATWFIPAMAQTEGFLFDLVVDDQDHSAEWLRRGEVVAAVTSHGKPIQGCNCHPLGTLRYLATASPEFVKRWLPDGLDERSAARAPCLVFNRKDQLQALWLRRALGADISPPVHWLPSSQAFVDAALAGLGWGMNLETTVEEHIRAGRLVALEPSEPLEVPLFWQQSRIVGPLLADLTRAVLNTARAMLSPMPSLA
ncbi:LysR family transcriptional regulator (chromosome initiation inhibitor) [Microvirga lupini]|uniref:LysR family transcriptional regulator (Chromosome initiation inhibitor) n=1 Tax=Microvirga lupini TaxID=420324 RepID=A0A7W4VJT2_9HYPH|nr:LysR family transcriptional regulator ArgP [Microvirga lupini]MBB3018509.1 LysR family transcriptional regulator (chromosome initiation inhibitor) [Microvirga lupini]